MPRNKKKGRTVKKNKAALDANKEKEEEWAKVKK